MRSVTLTVRDVGHFLSAFAAAFLTSWVVAGQPTTRGALYALAPAAATVAFRQVCPNLGQSATSVVPAVVVPVPEASTVDPTSRSAA